MIYHRPILQPPWSDADMAALAARNEARVKAAQAALGWRWLGVPMVRLVPAEPPIIIASNVRTLNVASGGVTAHFQGGKP